MSNGWLNSEDFYFNKIIENNIEIIRSEFLNVMRKKLLVYYSQVDPDTGEKNNNGWSGLHFRKRKLWIEENCKHAPNTVELLKSFPEINNQDKGVFGFSVVHPKSTIFPHTNGAGIHIRHRHQLCIHPDTELEETLTSMTVNNVSKTWTYGKVLSFDDGYVHSVINNSTRNRVVLIYDSVVPL